MDNSIRRKETHMNNHLPTISTCPIGEEQYVEFADRNKRGHLIRVQYDYRHTDGVLYSTIADDLEAARARRDAWLERRRIAAQEPA